MPFDLLMAVSHADTVLSWSENLTSDEMPPEWMWPFSQPLEIWFANVEEDRKAKYGGNSDDDRPSRMEKNQLAKHW